MKVSELSGALLDYWVGTAERLKVAIVGSTCYSGLNAVYMLSGEKGWAPAYSASTRWEIGGPILERERIGVTTWLNEQWCAAVELNAETHFDGGVLDGAHWQTGPTPLVAAMRCYVASQFGDEVPDEVPA